MWKGKVFEKKDNSISAEISEVVQGRVETGWLAMLIIHPMFQGRWKLIKELMSNKKHLEKMRFYVNENGKRECSMNMACIHGMERVPMSGDLALVIPVSIFNNKISLKMFKPVKLPNGDEGVFEPEDEEEQEKMIKWIKEKGYDYNVSSGQVFEKGTGMPREEDSDGDDDVEYHIQNKNKNYEEPEGPSVIPLFRQDKPVGPNEEKKE